LHEKIVEELLDPRLLGYPAQRCTPSFERCSIPVPTGSRCKLSKFATPSGPEVLGKTMPPRNQASSPSRNVY